MPRRLRDTSAGLFHVFAHCLWAVPWLFRDDIDRLEFLRHIAYATAKTRWTCLAYCVMSSHYHLIVRVDDGVLPVAMHMVNRRYARYYNRRYALRGHVLFERYGARRICDDLDLLDTFTYVARNPVEAGLCGDPSDYPWSSYAGTVGVGESSSFVDPSAVLRCVELIAGDAMAALRRRVELRSIPGTGLTGYLL